MPKGNETTTKFKVDISELKSAMQTARKEVALSNSEFKAVSSTMDDWSKSSEGISAKLKQLNGNLKSQETVLAQYEKILEEIKKEYGENSAEAREYATKLNNQKAVVNKIKKEIAGYEDALEEVSEAEKTAAKTGKSVADVLNDVGEEAKDAEGGFTTLKGAIATFVGNGLTALVGGLKNAVGAFVGLASETREYRDQMNKLTNAGTDAGYSADYVKQKYTDLYGVLADETATATTISNFTALNAEEETLNSLLNSSIGIWAKYGDSIPLDGLAESINETAKVGTVTGNLADALNWAGINEDKFNESLAQCTSEQGRQQLIANVLERTYGDLSKSYQESNKSVIDANKAQAEYTETLAQFGAKSEPVVTAVKAGFTDLLKEVLKLSDGADIGAFTSKIKEGFGVLKDDVLPAVKNGLGWILDNKDALIAGLAGIAGGFVAFNVASTIMGVVNAFKAFKAAQEGATIAQWLMNAAMNANPIILIVTLIASLVVALVTFIATNEDVRKKLGEVWDKAKEKIAGFVDSVKVFFTETIPAVFKSLIEWVKNNWQTILVFLTNPFAGLFKYFYENNGKFREFVDNAIAHIKQLPAKAWTWLLNTINKVITWRKNMITKAKEAALGFLNKVIEYVKQLPSKVWTWLVNVVSKIVTWRLNMLNKAKEVASDFVNKIIEYVKQLPAKFSTAFKSGLNAVVMFGKNLATKGKEAGLKLVNGVYDKAKEITNKIKSIGQDIVTGLWNGINNKFSWLTSQIKSFANGVTDKLKKFFGIHSPSRVMRDEIGKNLAKGVAEGITKNAKYAEKSAGELGELILESAQNKLDKYKVYNNLSLASEVTYWNKIRKTIAKGTKARIEADKNYLEAKKDLNAQLKELDKQYREDTTAVYDELMDNIDELTAKYEDSVKSRAESITSSLNLTEAFTIKDGVNKGDLATNLKGQVDALKEWDNTLTKLSGRGISAGLMAELESMGVDDLATLQAFASMSDAELKEYEKLYAQREQIAKQRAEKENADLKAQTEKDIEALIKSAESQLKALKKTYKQELKSLGVELKTDSVSVGSELINGVKKGMEDNKKYFSKYVKDFFKKTVDTAKKTLKIKSPSRVFADQVGKWIPEGIAVGITKNAKSVLKAMNELTLDSVGSARAGLGTATTSLGATGAVGGGVVNNFYQTINSPKQLSRLDIYRQSKNLLGYAGGGV